MKRFEISKAQRLMVICIKPFYRIANYHLLFSTYLKHSSYIYESAEKQKFVGQNYL